MSLASAAATLDKSKKKKVLRRLKKKEPKNIENCKTAMFIRGTKTNETITHLMKDLALLKKPDVFSFSKKK